MKKAETKIQKMKKNLPYGKYVFKDGSQILFNRHYEPLFLTEVGPNQKEILQAKIEDAKKQWFYSDSNSPWTNQDTLTKCKEILKVFGVQNEKS
ncbi:hypothetical protein P9B03_04000 [Metasolibacillus meyeri]|uniref:Uncharacterized protein n=1 Tax=Metasolibacillus meyeri TaxID=1071052 RepID=A0AAW9NKD6_9BACL|nr:hypothetical protein [Metasolibacillus meyeri]MEC1177637.1 hypothetical protein [Metasolibacillus meyeri]